MINAAITLGLTLLLHKGDVFGPPARPAQELWRKSAAGSETPAPAPVSFLGEDGTALRGWLIHAKHDDRPFLLLFYGSNEDALLERKRMEWFATIVDVNAVVFDYRGYGFSDGHIAPTLMRQDALGALDAVRRMAGAAPILIYGWSVGAEFAIHVAAQRKAAALILQAPPASADEMASASRAHEVPAVVRWAIRLRHDEETASVFQGAREIRGAAQPLLVLQGDADEVVPIEQGREVFVSSAAQDKRFLVVPGAHHNDLRISQPPAAQAIKDFVRTFGR